MASIHNVIEGLHILRKYVNEGDSSTICAAHDILYSAPNLSSGIKVSEEDKVRLKELNWFEDDESDSWGIFT